MREDQCKCYLNGMLCYVTLRYVDRRTLINTLRYVLSVNQP